MRRRSRRAAVLLFLAFVVMPVLEIVVLIQVGQVIGPWWTILLLVLDSIVGAWLIKREGRRAWLALRERVETGRLPARELADGVLVVLGGAFLLSPGFVTDVLGILLILPVTRPLFRSLLMAYAGRQVTRRTPPMAGNGPRPGPTVVRGEVIDEGE
ncbi:FxsA family protein [Nocardioides carbamazepini]|uniref:FxsA family protein n=1 Tax=Nocardioides carbamazepini TaxID=2854259 RepID=UPI00214A02F3|nr:FxsA family protein [Nocardioides carbamazepini]MCR1780925.1 FxsA family protein [Nocardioides carbamazepini]